jgi:SM-20-related protein
VDRPGQAEASDRYLNLMDSLREALNRGCSWAWKISKATSPCTRRGVLPQARRPFSRRRPAHGLGGGLPQRRLAAGRRRSVAHVPGAKTGIRCEPTGGCLVVFLSGEVPHEVLPATRERLSLTGWFRRRGNEPF